MGNLKDIEQQAADWEASGYIDAAEAARIRSKVRLTRILQWAAIFFATVSAVSFVLWIFAEELGI